MESPTNQLVSCPNCLSNSIQRWVKYLNSRNRSCKTSIYGVCTNFKCKKRYHTCPILSCGAMFSSPGATVKHFSKHTEATHYQSIDSYISTNCSTFMELERSKKESFKQKRKRLESEYDTDDINNLNPVSVFSNEETGFSEENIENEVEDEDDIDFFCDEQLFQYQDNELRLDKEIEKGIENHLIIQEDDCIQERSSHNELMTICPHIKQLFDRSREKIFENATILEQMTDKPPYLAQPLPVMEGYAPFKTYNRFHFTVNHHIRAERSLDHTDQLLRDIKTMYVTHGSADIPDSISEVVNCMKKISLMQPLPTTVTNCPNSVIYRISEIEANVLNNKELLSRMVFTSSTEATKNRTFKMSEVFLTPRWDEIMGQMRRKDPIALPLIPALFYDDFRRYRLAPGKCGGLYLVYLNMERSMWSKPENIFCLGLVSSLDDLWKVLQNVVQQLLQLYSVHRVRSGDSELLVHTRLGLFLADTPQRHDLCSCKRHNANMNCVHCMTDVDHGLVPFKSIDQLQGRDFERRSVPLARQHFQEWDDAATRAARQRIEELHGVKPIFIDQVKNDKGVWEGGTKIDNPLFQLSDFTIDGTAPPYDFDIFRDTPVDLFHLVLIGLFPTHIKMLDNILTDRERDKLGDAMRQLGCRLDYNQKEYWHGDNWLLYMSYAPFIYERVLLSGSPLMQRHYKCLLSGLEWMRALLSRNLSLEDIDTAERQWYKWFKMMQDLFPIAEISHKPNFHNTMHMFEVTRQWGPPVLYWTRPFEHKHKVFKKSIHRSNHKHELVWAAKQDFINQSLRFVYPHFRFVSERPFVKPPEVNSKIIFTSENRNKMYGIVTKRDDIFLIVRPLKIQSRHRYHNCPIVKDMQKRKEEEVIHISRYVGFMPVIDQYVNEYLLLNMIKK